MADERVEESVLHVVNTIVNAVEETERRNNLLESILEVDSSAAVKINDAELPTNNINNSCKDALTLKELAAKIRQNKQETSEKRKPENAFLDAVSSFISIDDNDDDFISTPTKIRVDQMGCSTPLEHLLQSFSPSVIRYMQQREDASEIKDHVLDFVEAMSPNAISLSAMASNYHNSYSNTYEDMLQQANASFKEESPLPRQRQYYPGSMLANQVSKNSSELPSLESYLSDDVEESCNKVKHFIAGKDYHDEVISSSEQDNAWSEINPLHGMLPENTLEPVMLSSHEEMAFLQQQIQAMASQQQTNTEQPYVLPVYFQPVMPVMADQNNQEVNEDRLVSEQNSIAWLTNQLLLNQYQLAMNSSQDNRSPNTSINMKYLEDAAMKLLQSDINNLAKNNDRSPGKFVCKYCNRHFRRNFTLQAHQRTHTGDKPFKCRFCGQGFRQSGTKLNHERAVHTKEKPFKCDFCPKTFSHKSSATVHRRIHTKEKPFECLICNRKFTDRATYSKHQSVHSDIKPYECPICGNKFSQKSNLKRHFQNVHSVLADNLATTITNETLEAIRNVLNQ